MELSRALSAPPAQRRPRLDRARGVLMGSCCETCGTASWPAAAVCRSCGSGAVVECALGPDGKLVTYSRVWVARPGLEAGYVLGQIDLVGGVRVFAHVHRLPEGASVPLPVRLVIGRPGSLPTFWFEPGEPVHG